MSIVKSNLSKFHFIVSLILLTTGSIYSQISDDCIVGYTNEWEIVSREFGGSLDGPFCPGEEVSIHFEFFYDNIEINGVDELSGIIPKFGNGWDTDNFDFTATPPIAAVAGNTPAQWHEEGTPLAPIIQETIDHMCTYVDENNVLRICNTICQTCDPCPNQGMMAGDALPSGYFWVTEGTESGCDNDGTPGEGYGVGSYITQVDWDFTIRVKEFDDITSCSQNTDLRISLQPVSDGLAGCRNGNNPQYFKEGLFGPEWVASCSFPASIVADDQEICNNEQTNISVTTFDGSSTEISVTPEANPNVTGASSYTFTNGSGTITDILTSSSYFPEEVIYNIQSIDGSQTCPGIVKQIIITVYPELEFEALENYTCEGDCTSIYLEYWGGYGSGANYMWSTGETTENIQVCPQENTTYGVTITDGLGCQINTEILVAVQPKTILFLPESIAVCKDESFDASDPDYIVCLEIDSGTPPNSVNWYTETGLIGEPAGAFGECFVINEVSSSEFAGPYLLEVESIDFFGCVSSTITEVNIIGELILAVEVEDILCGDTTANITVTGFDALGNPLSKFILYNGCGNDKIEIGSWSTINGTIQLPEINIKETDCISIEGITEEGCSITEDIELSIYNNIELTYAIDPYNCDDDILTLQASAYAIDGTVIEYIALYGGCPEDGLGVLLEYQDIDLSNPVNFELNLESFTCYTLVAANEDECTTYTDITFTQIDEIPIIEGNNKICQGDQSTITIINANLFTAIIWEELPDITDSFAMVMPDTTTTYNIIGLGTNGCESSSTFTIEVLDLESNFCADPCEDPSYDFQIVGTVFKDDNANGIQDSGEISLQNAQVTNLNTDFTTFTNENGIYTLKVDSGIVDIQANYGVGNWENNPILISDLEINTNCVDGIDFGFIPISNPPMASISVANTITRCDFQTKFFITVLNEGDIPFEGMVEFIFDDKTEFVSSQINGLTLTNNKISFSTGLLNSIESKTYEVTLLMPSGSTLLPLLEFSANIIFDGESLDDYNYEEQLRCSYDPNDKREFPNRPGEENLTLIEEMIEYTIRFQNNGNDTAFHVRLIDVLDSYIEPSSITFLDASHKFEACITHDSLIIDFPDIILVDSMTNYAASQGYISFRCHVDQTIPINTVIRNSVEIFFDSNSAILTNSTKNTMVESLCTNVTSSDSIQICQGESYSGYSESGFYQDTIIKTDGCDSITLLLLDVITPETFADEVIICEGDNYQYDGVIYSFDSSGIYTYDIIGPSDCVEKIYSFDVTVLSPDIEAFQFEVCEGTILNFMDNELLFDTSGMYEVHFFNQNGCLELQAQLDITVLEDLYLSIDTTICEGQFFEGLSSSGTYTLETADSLTGCPIFTTINLNVLPETDPGCITNITESEAKSILIFPNPTSEHLFIESKNKIDQLNMYAMNGQLIYQERFSKTKSLKLDVSTYNQGLYFVEVFIGAESIIRKITIN